MSTTQTSHVPVIIIGGGIVGLCASLFLSNQGIHSLLVERHAGTSIHPRARSVNARTMEIFRSMGITEAVREAGASMAPTRGIFSGSSLNSVLEKRPRRKEGPKSTSWVQSSGIGPENGLFVTQDMLEPAILKEAREKGGDVRFRTECLGVEQDEEKVTVTIRDREAGDISTVTADYLVAADGANSPIRSQLGVSTTGCGKMGNLLNILFRADLTDLVKTREFSLCRIENPEVVGIFTSINNSDRWVFHLSYDPLKGEKPEHFSPDRCKELLKIALGLPKIEVEIISILPWEPSVQVATKLQHGRIFLAGDAAHQMPPYGGQGANSGISDAHDLTWKLSAVLKGYASSRLLETFDIERQPVGKAAADVSSALADELGLIAIKRDWRTIKGFAKVMAYSSGYGYIYSNESPAVMIEDRWPLGGATWKAWSASSLLFSLDGRPGTRVPHVTVEKDWKEISTLDLVGNGFVLIAGSAGESWITASQNVRKSWPGLVLAEYCVGHSNGAVIDRKRLWETAAGISSSGALLVRPDGYVAWRQRRAPDRIQNTLEDVLKRLLCF
jgi:putative polyketide hydroxylase